jgi:hypothetical protein
MELRLARIGLVAALTAGLVGSMAGIAAAAVSPDQQAAVLAAQNKVRQATAAAETQRLGQTITIPDLTWNPDAAAVAQAWADNLLATNTFEHNTNRGDFGENIYFESGSDPATSADRAVASWAAEQASYTWDTNSCSDQCGHYTQIVWAATTSVGCGMATDGTKTIWVCDYAPPGNFTGQRPYEPGAGAPAASMTTGGAAPSTGTGDNGAAPSSDAGAGSTDTSGSSDGSGDQPTDTPSADQTPGD